MKILFKYPTRGRPELFKKTLVDFYVKLSGMNNCQFVISIDEDDKSMNNEEIKKMLEGFSKLKVFVGKHTNKVDAGNRDLAELDWDVVVVIGDDTVPVKDYDNKIVKAMKKYFPDLDGVLHLNDGIQGKRMNTTPAIGRKYFERFGYVSNPIYKSVYGDVELTEVSRRLGKTIYIDEIILKHDWIGFKGMDKTLKENNANIEEDKKVFDRRKAEGFK